MTKVTPDEPVEEEHQDGRDELADSDYDTEFDRDDYECSGLAREPQFEVEEQVVDTSSHYIRNPLRLKVGKDERHYGRANLNFGHRYLKQGRPWEYKEEKDAVKFERALDKQKICRQGRIEEEGEELKVYCGIRRAAKISEKEISKGVNLFSNIEGVRHSERVPTPSFYPSLIYPHVKDSAAATPFDWAFERTQLSLGMAYQMGLVNDFTPSSAAYPYERMAKFVFNTTPQSLVEPRTIGMDAKRKNLRARLDKTLGGNAPVELVWFILNNGDEFEPDFFDDKKLVELLKKTNQLLSNGVVIDRVQELYAMVSTKGLTAKDALIFTMSIFSRIYGGRAQPWWFREDIDITKVFDLETDECKVENGEFKIACNTEGRDIVGTLAAKADFAFEYAAEIYRKKGHELAKFVDTRNAIALSTRIAKTYGIGNVQRACNTLQFICEALVDGGGNAKTLLPQLFKYIMDKRPDSAMMGRLEGEDAIIPFPGLVGAVQKRIGVEEMQKDQLDYMTMRPKHIRALAEMFALPLGQRARFEPFIRDEYAGGPRLLTAGSVQPLLLATSIHDTSTAEVPGYLEKLLGLYKRITDVVGNHSLEDFANMYLSFYAAKMPDPFNPPAGFIELLAKYKAVRIPGYEYDFFQHELDRGATRRNNANLVVEKFQSVSHMLDAYLMGLISWDDFTKIFEWIHDEKGLEDEAREMFRQDNERYPEHAREISDEEVKSQADRMHDTRQTERLGAFMASAKIAVLFNALVVLGIIDQSIVGRVLKSFFDSVMPDPQKLQQVVGKSPFDPRKSIQVMEQLVGVGVLQVSEISEYFRVNESESEEELLNKIFSLVIFLEALANINIEEYLRGEESPTQPKKLSDSMVEKLAGVLVFLRTQLAKVGLGDLPDPISRNLVLGQSSRVFNLVLTATALSQPTGNLSLKNTPAGGNVGRISHGIASTITIAVGMGENLQHEAEVTRDAQGSESIVHGTRTRAMQVISNAQQRYSHVREALLQMRPAGVGLLPVGGKIHLHTPVDDKYFNLFRKHTGLDSTAFRLLHADKLINLPAAPTAAEMKLLVEALQIAKLFNPERPELQISLPGRLNPHDVAFLASFVLLSTQLQREYDPQSFCTNQDFATGSRMMAYDAGGSLVKLPFMKELNGRTDILGRMTPHDFELVQIIGSILIQDQYGGPMGHLAKEFRPAFVEILRKHRLTHVLKAPWIYLPNSHRMNNAENMDHYRAVKSCTDAYFACADRFQKTQQEKGVIFETRALFGDMREKMRPIQHRMIQEMKPGDDVDAMLSL